MNHDETIFAEALGIVSPQAREEFLCRACVGNQAMFERVQGLLAEFVAREVELLRPRRLILGHHDDWLPGVSVATDTTPIRTAVDQVSPETELVEMPYCAGLSVFERKRTRCQEMPLKDCGEDHVDICRKLGPRRLRMCCLLLRSEVGGSAANRDACRNDHDLQWRNAGGDCIAR